MASLYSRIGKPNQNFTSAGNPARRSQWGGVSAAQGQKARDPNFRPPPANWRGGGSMLRDMPAGMNTLSTSGQWGHTDPSTMAPSGPVNSRSGYQPPGLPQGGGATPLDRPPQAPPNLGGGQQPPMGWGNLPRPGDPDWQGGMYGGTFYDFTGVKGGTCFVAGTKVAVSNKGTKNIEDVEVGDLVVCYDTTSDTLEESAVTHTFTHPDTDGYLVVNESLGVTPNHEIYTGTGWVSAGNLEVGDNIQMIGGGLTKVSNIEKVDKSVTTHNLEVANRHNYYADGVLVHNKQAIQTPEEKARAEEWRRNNPQGQTSLDEFGAEETAWRKANPIEFDPETGKALVGQRLYSPEMGERMAEQRRRAGGQRPPPNPMGGGIPYGTGTPPPGHQYSRARGQRPPPNPMGGGLRTGYMRR